MSCSQTLSGIARDCKGNMGGVAEVYIANRDDVSAVTLTEGKVSAITMASGKTFQVYQFNRGTASMTSTYNISAENGTKYVGTDLVLVFSRMETAKRIEMTALAVNDLYVIVKDANGLFWLLGYDHPVNAGTGDANTGTAIADRNGYSITLHDDSAELPYEVLSSIIDGLLPA